MAWTQYSQMTCARGTPSPSEIHMAPYSSNCCPSATEVPSADPKYTPNFDFTEIAFIICQSLSQRIAIAYRCDKLKIFPGPRTPRPASRFQEPSLPTTTGKVHLPLLHQKSPEASTQYGNTDEHGNIWEQHMRTKVEWYGMILHDAQWCIIIYSIDVQ